MGIALLNYHVPTSSDEVLCLKFNVFQFLGILKPNYNSVDLTEVEHVDNDNIIIGHSDPGVTEVGEITVVLISWLKNIISSSSSSYDICGSGSSSSIDSISSGSSGIGSINGGGGGGGGGGDSSSSISGCSSCSSGGGGAQDYHKA
jgi:hypothetical protein